MRERMVVVNVRCPVDLVRELDRLVAEKRAALQQRGRYWEARRYKRSRVVRVALSYAIRRLARGGLGPRELDRCLAGWGG